MSTHAALLALADGTLFTGQAIGALGLSVGEVVFNTAMVGYQEILSDPSYCQQLITLTYPHIGNVGVNEEDQESSTIYAAGLIVREAPVSYSNFRATLSLPDYLRAQGVVAIAGIDTRQLTRLLRERGAQAGAIMAGEIDPARALELARASASMTGQDLTQRVSCERPFAWTEGEWSLARKTPPRQDARYHVLVYDFGVKHTILRMLVERGCRLTVVPANTTAQEALVLAPDGVLLSNGPGDPQACANAIAAVRELLAWGKPLFGICLGHQLLALACGAHTSKMKFGHHGANHPVQDLENARVMITSQNHGFQVDETSLPDTVEVTHRSLFDGSVQGIRLTDRPAFGFQGHPEASPGPQDMAYLFDRFVSAIQASQTC